MNQGAAASGGILDTTINPPISQITENDEDDDDPFNCQPSDENEFFRKMSIRSINTN